jgi:DNA-binding NarL/FixJ family response regulator
MSATATVELPVILVVEDDHEALEQRTNMLATMECTAIGFENDDEAREAMLESLVDLVLTDIRLKPSKGDRSGIEFARYVKRIYPDMPVLGYSAVFADKDLAPLEKEIFDEVWPKTLNFLQIEEMLQRCRELALEHREQRRAALWELFLKNKMFDMRTLPSAVTVLPDLDERDETILRLVGEGLPPRDIAEQLDIDEGELYRFVGWVLDELPPEPWGETVADIHARHGSQPASEADLEEFERLYGPSLPPDDEG